MKLAIFTKPVHVEKIVNYLNQYTEVDYIISTDKLEERFNQYDYDIGVSYCWPYRVQLTEMINMDDAKPEKVWFNYHPSLQQYPGLSNYIQPIKDGVTSHGVMLHRMSDKIDKGEVIESRVFQLDSVPTHTNELGCISHYYLFQLFKDTIEGLEEWV